MSDEIEMREDDPPSKKKETCLAKVERLLQDKLRTGRPAIFTHPFPDPDAIGSMMGLAWLLQKKYDVEADCFFDGQVSHPQNMAMINLLEPDLKNLHDYNPKITLLLMP